MKEFSGFYYAGGAYMLVSAIILLILKGTNSILLPIFKLFFWVGAFLIVAGFLLYIIKKLT